MPLMRHPGLPEGQTIDAQDIQVHHYQRSGWEVVPDDPPEDGAPPPETADQTTEAPADAGASALPGDDDPADTADADPETATEPPKRKRGAPQGG